jgi:hypothetical protein
MQVEELSKGELKASTLGAIEGVVCRALHFFGFSNLTIQKAL